MNQHEHYVKWSFLLSNSVIANTQIMEYWLVYANI